MYSYDDDEDEEYPQEQPPPRDNLQKYVLEAVPLKMTLGRKCPAIPGPDEHIQPVNYAMLSTKPDCRHKLQEVCLLRPATAMQNRIKKFLQSIPSQPLPDGDYDIEINMDAASFSVVQTVLPRLESIQELMCGVMSILSTAERILKLTCPEETAGYTAYVPDLPPLPRPKGGLSDNDICRSILWKKVGERSESLRLSTTKMIVMVMAPWALGTLEMKDFLEIGLYVPYETRKRNSPLHTYTRAQRIWAKLWDDCASKKCQFFAVTNYACWVFGVFVNGMTRAICSPIIETQDTEPCTILQWLMFWIGSSMKLPLTWTPPAFEDYGNPDITDPDDVADRLLEDNPMSDEDWVKAHMKEVSTDNWSTREVAPNVWFTTHP